MKTILTTAIILLIASCSGKSCNEVTDKDIVGYYVPDYSVNKGKQYIEILKNYTFTMYYCDGDSIVIEQGTWDRYSGCSVELDGIRWLWIPEEFGGISRSKATFTWVRGMLSFGDCTSSFQKVRRKPKLRCEE